ncbi:MAG: hypothetical protein CM15mP14_4170 [Rhodospirillaceae bacterium]|nr:MAG: hypothetical protein CM15mP14_4170 [Rhodospirillaceae bacterium]
MKKQPRDLGQVATQSRTVSRSIHYGFVKRRLRILWTDAIIVVDGQEILNTDVNLCLHFPKGHRLNSAPFGTMGERITIRLGAKIQTRQTRIVVHGDGSFGLNFYGT